METKDLTMVTVDCMLDTIYNFKLAVAKRADELDPTHEHPVFTKETMKFAYEPLFNLLDKQPRKQRDLLYTILENLMADAGESEYIATLGDTYNSVVNIQAERLTKADR